MRTPVRIGAYVLTLGALFAAALGVGAGVGPIGEEPAAEAGHAMGADATNGGHSQMAGHADEMPGGLSVSTDGYTFRPVNSVLPAGSTERFRFTIEGPDGAPIRRYTELHAKDLHLIVVRRDGTHYQHLHPSLGADGMWSIPLQLNAGGDYRAFADFDPAGDRTGPTTLGVDLHATGTYRPQVTPPPSRVSTVDGYQVTMTGRLKPGASSLLTLSVRKDGRPVTDLQPYLAAYGHLVALRTGDLAYLHVHPDGEPGDGKTRSGPDVVFHAEVPTSGTYRLYLDFRHGGRVHTAQFTATAE